jgi:spore coat protein H
MVIHSLLRRSCLRLAPLALAFCTLHCDDGAIIIQPPTDPATSELGGDDSSPDNPEASADPLDGDPSGTAPSPNGGTEVSNGDPSGNTPLEPGLPSGASPGSEGPLGACQPRAAGGPFWITEEGTVQIAIECATGEGLAGDAFRFDNLPRNAQFDAASRTLTFTPGLDQAGVYSIDVGVAGRSELGRFEVQVADRFDAPGNVPVDPATYTEEFGLPVVHLTVDPGINADAHLPASITYRGHAFEGAQAKYRGQTSLKYPQKSFTLKFTKEDRFSETVRAVGFTGKRKLTLTTTFDDNSYLRARLSFNLWNRVDPEHVQVRAYSAVLYLNGQFAGIYTVTDHVDRHLIEDSDLFEDGNLFKARSHDANFRLVRSTDPPEPKLSLAEGYTKEEGTPLEGEPGANADLEALVSWVANSSSADFLAELDSRIVRREYEDWWLLVSLIIADDSASKNSYHYHDPRVGAPDGRFHVVPWDFNDSFGQSFLTFRGGREATRDAEELAEYNLLFERLLAEPATRTPLLTRFRTTLRDEWELTSVLQTFDAFAAEIQDVAVRNERLWGATYRETFAEYRTDFTTHAEEIAFMRQWIIDRWTFVANDYL